MSPSLAATKSGFLLSWIEPQGGGSAVRYAHFEDSKWSEPRTIASGNEILANWARSPAVAQAAGGWLLAAWPAKAGSQPYDQAIRLARAEGLSGPWRPLASPHDDRSGNEHDFPALLPEGDSIRVFWLDGRAMKHGGAMGQDEGDMALRTALVGQRPGKDELLDARTCECCSLSAAATAAGPIVVYRDRSEGEVRDIAIVRRMPSSWTKPALVANDRWKIAGCPINGPAVAASGREVAAAWFTAADGRARVEAAFSGDSGATFGKPIVVDEASPLGRVSVILDKNDAIVAWLAGGRTPAIRLRRVRRSGSPGEPATVAQTSAGHSSGFPTLARSGANLMVAWVEAAQTTRVRAATIPSAAVP